MFLKIYEQDKGQHERAKQIKVLNQELKDMEESHSDIAGSTRILNKKSVVIIKVTFSLKILLQKVTRHIIMIN